MPSNARLSFDENAKDIQRLLKIHETVGGNVQGRRYQLEVLNKSAIVLITAFWEAYCEDIASEALSNIITNSTNSTSLPDELKKIVAKQLKAETHELAIWRLADNGWKTCLNDRFEAMRLDRDKKLNTPKTVQINSLFYDTIGLKEVSKSWYWQNMSATNSAKTLDEMVTLRGAIAHRGSHSKSVKKVEVESYFAFIQNLTSKTGGAVNRHVISITNVAMW